MADSAQSLDHLQDFLQEWFRQNPNLRPTEAPWRAMFLDIEARWHLGGLSIATKAGLAMRGVPIGSGRLLPLGIEVDVLRHIKLLRQTKAKWSLLAWDRDQQTRLVVTHIQDWVHQQRQRYRTAPQSIHCLAIRQAMPEFPFEGSLGVWLRGPARVHKGKVHHGPILAQGLLEQGAGVAWTPGSDSALSHVAPDDSAEEATARRYR